jgi:hypothetical protein
MPFAPHPQPTGGPALDPATAIRLAVERVQVLRTKASDHPGLGSALHAVKGFQAQRFTHTYADLLAPGPYAQAARFFLEELYSSRDYAQRDAQFARIAGALQRLFPQPVVGTALRLAELHALTEEIDFAMAQAWHPAPQAIAAEPGAIALPSHYVAVWRAVGQRDGRLRQLQGVLSMGEDLSRLTRTPGLRMGLKMMRGPARAAGLSALQHFLELGFDTFAGMRAAPGGSEHFLAQVQARESRLIEALFDAELAHAAALLGPTLPSG